MTNYFFDETLNFTTSPDYSSHRLRMSNLEVGAIGLQMSFLLVDQYKRTITLCSHTPELTDIFEITEAKPLNKEFIKALFSTNDYGTFNTQVIKTVNLILKRGVCDTNNRMYCLSFNLPIIIANGTVKILKFKVIPDKFTCTSEDGVPWLIYYNISNADTDQIGCFKLIDLYNSEEYSVFITDNPKCTPEYELLSKNDIRILQLSCDGLTEPEITEQLGTNMGIMKHLKTNLLYRLNAKSITHAINKTKKQGLI